MNFSLAQVDFLLSEAAQPWLEALGRADLRDTALLPVLTELRKHLAPDQASAVVELARLRQEATTKFTDPSGLFFTDEALQQASTESVARYRAQRFDSAWTVAELGAGIGADTFALARRVKRVIAYEIDPVRARFLQANLEVLGLAQKVDIHQTDWTNATIEADAAFADPARRRDGKRLRGLAQIIPPFSAIEALRRHLPTIAVKLSPGVDYENEALRDWSIEIISENGDCKEILVGCGAFYSGKATLATILPAGQQLRGDPSQMLVDVSMPQACIYEPDAAVIRAHLVQHLAQQMGATQIDSQIAYLTTAHPVETPFARGWEILQHGPFHKKQLKRWLREMDAGEIILKKRGSPIELESFLRQLKPSAQGIQVTVFLTRVQNQPWMLLGQPLA
jgi:hypothetical protein